MSKILLTSVMVSGMLVFSTGINANGEDANKCILECNKYYNSHNNLAGFAYYTSLASKVIGAFTSTKAKEKYCKENADVLANCYKSTSITYGVCKLAAKSITSLFTSDPNWTDWFSSCKNTCASDLFKACEGVKIKQ